jgi:hypothetical protein
VLVLAPVGADATGPDLVVRSMQDAAAWGSSADGRNAYSVGVSPCNRGDVPVAWNTGTPAHPVFVTNLYRLHDGRFEQIGLSWAAREFCAVQQECDACVPTNCQTLGVGCMDTSAPSVTGARSNFAPRSEIDPVTGVFTLPTTLPGGPEPPVLQGRLVVARADLDPALNAGASYLVEIVYIAADDAAAGNDANNASWRAVDVEASADGLFPLDFTGPTREQRSAIRGWKELDPAVQLVSIDVPGDGRFTIGARVTDRLDGTWSYEYAVFNLDSERAAGGFEVPATPGVAVTALGFRDVDHHSGEVWDGADWPGQVAGARVSWATTPFGVDPLANAIRWGTLYAFRFVADVPPRPSPATLHLFRPSGGAGPDAIEVTLPAPRRCASDLDASGATDVTDLLGVLAAWGPCAGCPTDVDGDGAVAVGDLLDVLGTWGPCGP